MSSGGGALTQIAAIGQQDTYISCDPQITFWKGGYKRHTNFALTEMEQTFSGTTGFGRRMTATINRSGDLMCQMYLRATLPAIVGAGTNTAPNDTLTDNYAHWVSKVGYAMINEVYVDIGGHTFDTWTGDMLNIFEEISAPAGKEVSLGEMIGPLDDVKETSVQYSNRPQQLHVPLRFWFNRFYENALPLIALQYHSITVNVSLNPVTNLVTTAGQYAVSTSPPRTAANTSNVAAGAASGDLSGVDLLITYVYLDNLERRLFASQPHEYLIDQIQFTGGEQRNTTIKLNFNHPVKEILWVAVRDDAESPPFDYSGNAITGAMSGADNPHVDPFVTAQFFLNGHMRTVAHRARYYRSVQLHQHHTRIPDLGTYIYAYSFALWPEDNRPTGSCNFSRIDNASVRFTFVDNDETLTVNNQTWTGQFLFFARSMNIVKITGGMAGLTYAD